MSWAIVRSAGISMPETVRPAGGGDRPDVHRAEQPVGDRLVAVGVGVVHPDRRLGRREAVRERLAAADEVLGDRRDAVLVVGQVDAVPVDVGADRQLVGELDLDGVADGEVDARAGDLAVVGPRLDERCRATTSQSTIDVVSSKCLVPSARIVGSSGWLPRPAVSAGKARTDSIIAWSIATPSSGVIAVSRRARRRVMPIAAASSTAPAGAVAAPSPIVSGVSMPDSTWPAMSQNSV